MIRSADAFVGVNVTLTASRVGVALMSSTMFNWLAGLMRIAVGGCVIAMSVRGRTLMGIGAGAAYRLTCCVMVTDMREMSNCAVPRFSDRVALYVVCAQRKTKMRV